MTVINFIVLRLLEEIG